jgi:hypothetical protein
MINGRRGELVTLQWFGPMYIELVGNVEFTAIEAATAQRMHEQGFGPLSTMSAPQYSAEQARRVLTVAARDPNDRKLPFGSAEQWGELDTDLLSIAWQGYGDVRERLDPMSVPLTEAEAIAIQSAVKKKDAAYLRTFGVVRLSAWLASTGGQLSTSPTPSSPSSESLSEPCESSTES